METNVLLEQYSWYKRQQLAESPYSCLLNADIEPNPHQINAFCAAIQALKTGGIILADEVGLGKTIEAIAAMAHLSRQEPGSHFLVVCPASVMVNWCREIRKFSDLEAYLLHGRQLEENFRAWHERDGAAVTNYESMRAVSGLVNNRMKLSMLVIDEAHYIKNPDAQRTKFIHKLEDESGHILLMTGTPLENRVDEMCELISFLRPDLADTVRKHAGMRHTEAFRELLSPVYLRRRVDQVLDELPERTDQEEWCTMTQQDLVGYTQALRERIFMAMRLP